jgi:hypothetical protein
VLSGVGTPITHFHMDLDDLCLFEKNGQFLEPSFFSFVEFKEKS